MLLKNSKQKLALQSIRKERSLALSPAFFRLEVAGMEKACLYMEAEEQSGMHSKRR